MKKSWPLSILCFLMMIGSLWFWAHAGHHVRGEAYEIAAGVSGFATTVLGTILTIVTNPLIKD